jgi:hypothetical protein
VEPRRPPKPINITSLAKISALFTNYVNVSWAVEPGWSNNPVPCTKYEESHFYEISGKISYQQF